jgi:hypothetical protein
MYQFVDLFIYFWSAPDSQSNSANGDPIAASLTDPDEGETKMENMSDMQKLFFNKGNTHFNVEIYL